MNIKTMSLHFGAAAAIVLSAPATADIFTSEASFLDAIETGFYFEDFNTVADGNVPSLDFGPVNGFSFTISAVTDNLFNMGGEISHNFGNDQLQIDFTGAPVTAVGGNFFATDINFNAITAEISIVLSDGTVEIFESSSSEDFRGFTTDGPAITSVTIDGIDEIVTSWATLDNLYVGVAVIPAPGCGLIAIGAFAAIGRRRRG